MRGWWCIFGVIPVLETLAMMVLPSECPDVCICQNFIVNCQRSGLTDLPDGINNEVNNLDLSINNFEDIPKKLRSYTSLKYLNMSYNRIAALGHLDFSGLMGLEILDLSYNLFHDWKDIHSQAFTALTNLTMIEFSNNPVRSLPPSSTHFAIKSLEILKFNNCSMNTIPSGLLGGIRNIKEIHLATNPITTLSLPFSSKSLKFMDLSNSSLMYSAADVFQNLEVLETLRMNKNKYLRNITINSDSLLYLDLSESFLETAPFGNMRALATLNLHGNIIRDLPNDKFINVPNLTILNLSLNAITAIEENAFRGLEDLKRLDLSLNKISGIEENTFLTTKSLFLLDLSHNYLTLLDSITSISLNILDVSYCEIKYVSKYALSTLPKLTYLSLKRNFITYIPDAWAADRLTILDLSECRIKNINNKTFSEMPYLRELDLSNNRLTTILFSYFPQSLSLIKLKDNQWRCDCPVLKNTFNWLQNRGTSMENLICDSPDNVNGLTWESACQDLWYPPTNKKDQLWWYSLALLISMVFLLLTVIALRKLNDVREQRYREMEERRLQQEREARESLQRMQQMQREYREEANRNAPDPRDSQGPPSYNDALLLPRLNTSQLSLDGSMVSLGSRGSLHGSNSEVNKKGKVRRKRRRKRSESTEGIHSLPVIDNSNETDPDRAQRPLESDF